MKIEQGSRPTSTQAPRSVLEHVLDPLADAALAVADGRLARIWLEGRGDSCPTCPMRSECPDRRRCLHLVASAGLTGRLDGPYRRYPIGAREVGGVPVTGRAFEAREGLEALGLADPRWLANHGIRSFIALPLTLGRRTIGVLAVFGGYLLDPPDRAVLEGIARLGAIALGSLRAYRELAAERNHAVARAARAGGRATAAATPAIGDDRLLRPFADTEREVVARVLAHTGGRVSGPRGAAAILGLKPTTLFSRMKKLGIERRPRARAGAQDPPRP